MMEFGACPRCKMDISAERKVLKPFICNHCGFTSASNDALSNEIEKKATTIMVIFSLIAILGYVQIANWDTAFLSIIPLTIKDTLGMSSKADLENKAQICLDLKKYDCTAETYNRIATAEPALWTRAAHFQMSRAKYNEAAQAYYKFFQGGGQDLEASYNYAKSLSQLGQVDEAIKYFDQVLAAKPDTLQVTVIGNYVKLLVDNKRFEQAKVLINRVRKDGGESAGSFMESEYQKIQALSQASRD